MLPSPLHVRARSAAAFLAIILAACGGATDPGERPAVATVVVSGTPASYLVVGGTAQLVATGLTATGSTVSGAQMSWRSSDEGVATVSGGGLVTARGPGTAVVTATSGTGTATVSVDVKGALAVTAAGGTVALPDGRFSLTVPSGSIVQPMTLLVGPGRVAATDSKLVPGTLYDVGLAGGGGWIAGATVSIRYEASRVPAGVAANALQLYTYHPTQGGWVVVRGSGSDPARGVVAGAYVGPGTYAVRGTAVARLALGGTAADGALYTGQTVALAAVALAADGDTLRGRTVAWNSSADGVLRVDAQGNATGVGPGTATVTASAEGVSTTTTVVVLARPTAQWDEPGDWSTFQGNNRRTGYVAATLDPTAFVKRWEATLEAAAGSTNQVVTGDGNVYATTNSYFGAQALRALDPVTGAVRWTRAFGNIHSVNGAATGNGRVYVSTGGHSDSFLWSFAPADGAVAFRTAYGNQWSRWFAPAVTADAVYLGGGYYGGMSGFSALTGTRLWYRDLPQEDAWTPAVAGGKVYAFGTSAGTGVGLLTMDPATGAGTPTMTTEGLPAAGTPVLGDANDVLVIRGSRLLALDLARNAVAWSQSGAYLGMPAVGDGTVYAVVSGQVEARRESDGKLQWTWVPPAGRAARAVLATRNLLFVTLGGGDAYFGAPSTSTVAVDIAAHRAVWSYPAGGELSLSRGVLYIAQSPGGKVSAIAVR
jgi:hypothetical protein